MKSGWNNHGKQYGKHHKLLILSKVSNVFHNVIQFTGTESQLISVHLSRAEEGCLTNRQFGRNERKTRGDSVFSVLAQPLVSLRFCCPDLLRAPSEVHSANNVIMYLWKGDANDNEMEKKTCAGLQEMGTCE